MTNLERQTLIDKMNSLILPYDKSYKGRQPYSRTDANNKIWFEPEFLNHLSSDTKSAVEDIVSLLNAS